MLRRDITRLVLGSAVGTALIAQKAQAQTCSPPCFPQTPAEQAAQITPTSYEYDTVVVNPDRYGAVGNGIADDTGAFTAAVAVLQRTAGGTLQLTSGKKYSIRGVVLPRNTTLSMFGAKLIGMEAATHVIEATVGCTIQGGEIDCALATGHGIFAPNASHTRVLNTTIRKAKLSGISFQQNTEQNPENIAIEGCHIFSCVWRGIELAGAFTRARIAGNYIEDCQHGIQLFGDYATTPLAAAKLVADVTIVNNVTKNLKQGGIWASRATRVSIVGNSVFGAEDVGIDLEGCLDCAITGNALRDCQNAAISLFYDSQNVTIVGNAIDINKVPGAKPYYGIWLTANGTELGFKNIRIADNVIRTTHGSTTTLSAGILTNLVIVDGVTIAGNQLRDCFMHLRAGVQNLLVEGNQIRIEHFTGAQGGIVCEGLKNFDIRSNQLIRSSTDSGTTRPAAGIYTVYVSAAYPGEHYSVVGNRILGWRKSFADDYGGAGKSRALIKDNLVSGTLERSAMGFVGQIAQNYNADTPSTIVNETTY